MSKELNEILLGAFDELSDVSTLLSSLQWITVESSNLAAVAYRPNEYELYIAFLDGSVYVYDGVPVEEYDDLLAADSHGEYFYDNIRLVYSYERLEG